VALYFDGSGFGGTAGSEDDWAAVATWQAGLNADQYPALGHLIGNGWEDDLSTLETDVEGALKDNPPPEVARSSLEGFLSALKDRAEGDSAVAITLNDSDEPDLIADEPVEYVTLDEEVSLNAWSDAARAASIEARRRSGQAHEATVGTGTSKALGRSSTAVALAEHTDNSPFDHVVAASAHRQAAASHKDQATEAHASGNGSLAEAHHDAAMGHELASDAHHNALAARVGGPTASAARATYETGAFGVGRNKEIALAKEAVVKADAGDKSGASLAHTNAAAAHSRRARGAAAADHRQAADLHRQAARSLAGNSAEEVFDIPTDNARKPSRILDISPDKACQILKDGTVRGKELTTRQRGLFGVICGRRGKKPTGNSAEDFDPEELDYALAVDELSLMAQDGELPAEEFVGNEECEVVLDSELGEVVGNVWSDAAREAAKRARQAGAFNKSHESTYKHHIWDHPATGDKVELRTSTIYHKVKNLRDPQKTKHIAEIHFNGNEVASFTARGEGHEKRASLEKKAADHLQKHFGIEHRGMYNTGDDPVSNEEDLGDVAVNLMDPIPQMEPYGTPTMYSISPSAYTTGVKGADEASGKARVDSHLALDKAGHRAAAKSHLKAAMAHLDGAHNVVAGSGGMSMPQLHAHLDAARQHLSAARMHAGNYGPDQSI
jgi:hypothetical protein